MANSSAGSLVVEELLLLLGLETDDKSFDDAKANADKVIDGFEDIVKKAALATGAVFSAVSVWVDSYATAANETAKLASRIGATVEEIQELDYVAEKSSISVDFMRKAIEKLNAKSAQVSSNKDLADTFSKLGIDAAAFAKVSPGEKVERLADAIMSLPTEAERSAIAMKLFEEEGLAVINALEGGSARIKELREQARQLGLFTAEDAKAAEEYESVMVDTRRSFTALRNEVGAALLPVLTDLLATFRDFFMQNRELLSQGIVTLFSALATVMKVLVSLTAVWVSFKLGHYVMVLAAAFRSLTVASAAANASVMLIPILIGAALIGIALLAEDLYGFFTGADSLIGRFAERFPIIGTILASIGDAMYDMIQVGDGLLDILMGIITLDWSRMTRGLGKIAEVMEKHLKTIVDAVKWAVDTASSYLPDFGGFGLGMLNPFTASGTAASIPTTPTAPNQSVVNNNKAGTTVNDNRTIEINGADIGAVKKILKEDYSLSTKSINSGIDY